MVIIIDAGAIEDVESGLGYILLAGVNEQSDACEEDVDVIFRDDTIDGLDDGVGNLGEKGCSEGFVSLNPEVNLREFCTVYVDHLDYCFVFGEV